VWEGEEEEGVMGKWKVRGWRGEG